MPYFVLILIISLLVAVFAVQNAIPVTVSLFVWQTQTSLVVVILGFTLCGALAVAFLALMMKARHYLATKKLLGELTILQKDNAKLHEKITMLMRVQKLESAAKVASSSMQK